MTCTSCLHAARDLAEKLLMDADNYDPETRLVKSADLLTLVQKLNGALFEPPHDA